MILQKIKDTAPELAEEDLDSWVVPELVEHYKLKINSLARYTFGTHSPLAVRAFTQLAYEELRKGVIAFVFTAEHWKKNRDINPYLLTCLNRLSSRTRAECSGNKKINIPVCPVCKMFGEREYLQNESGILKCYGCDNAIKTLEEQLSVTDDAEAINSIESKIELRKVFVAHSRRGYRCPDCERFIPESYVKQYGVTCPYNDCAFFGTRHELEFMTHPLGLGTQNMISFNAAFPNNRGNEDFTLEKIVKNDLDASNYVLVTEEYKNDLELLNSVVDMQIQQIKRNESAIRGRLKLLMYEAYKYFIEKYPEDMVAYLVHRKHASGPPIQSRIFQKYVDIVLNELPFSVKSKGKQIEVCSLLEPELGLFLGVSEFEAAVEGGVIPNNTVETYTGGIKLKCFGPCFIGLLADVEDLSTGESLMDKVKNYTFVQINVDESIKPGTRVKVTHFRIPSHYEMGSLVYLQRIRRKIVDSVYFKKYGKKRKPRRNEKSQESD